MTLFFCVLCSFLNSDCEYFLSEVLYDESLTENAQESRQILLNNFRIVHSRLGITHQFFFVKDTATVSHASDSKITLNLEVTLERLIANLHQNEAIKP